jgi:hypothetical protein
MFCRKGDDITWEIWCVLPLQKLQYIVRYYTISLLVITGGRSGRWQPVQNKNSQICKKVQALGICCSCPPSILYSAIMCQKCHTKILHNYSICTSHICNIIWFDSCKSNYCKVTRAPDALHSIRIRWFYHPPQCCQVLPSLHGHFSPKPRPFWHLPRPHTIKIHLFTLS